MNIQTRTGPSVGACASPQGLPACQIWLSKSNKCIKATDKVSLLLTVRVVLLSLPFFCWEGWDVNAEGLFYVCQVLFHCSPEGKCCPAAGLHLCSCSQGRCFHPGALQGVLITAGWHPPHCTLCPHIPGVCSHTSLHCRVQTCCTRHGANIRLMAKFRCPMFYIQIYFTASFKPQSWLV